jgi:hypothetical protein
MAQHILGISRYICHWSLEFRPLVEEANGDDCICSDYKATFRSQRKIRLSNPRPRRLEAPYKTSTIAMVPSAKYQHLTDLTGRDGSFNGISYCLFRFSSSRLSFSFNSIKHAWSSELQEDTAHGAFFSWTSTLITTRTSSLSFCNGLQILTNLQATRYFLDTDVLNGLF